MRKLILFAAAFLTLSTAAPPALHAQGADEETPFDANVRRGLEAYKDRRYSAAIKYFRDAYGMKADPTLIFNIAKSYERLGKIDDAISHYQTYVDAPGTTAEDRADALSKIKALRQEQAARDAASRAQEPPPPALPPESTGTPPDRTPPAGTPPVAETPSGKATGPIVLVVHRANAVASLSKDQLKNIYLGRMTVWPNGERIRPFGRLRASQAASVFFGPATGLSAGQYAQIWQQKQLSGSGLAPATVDTAAELLKSVAANEGAIGYLLPAEVPSSLNGVRVVELR